MIYDVLEYVLTFLCFTSETNLIAIIYFYWDLNVLRSFTPKELSAHNDCTASQRNGKREFSEDADGIVASIHWTSATGENPAVFPGVMIGHRDRAGVVEEGIPLP
jgi:hypothetical protein